MNKEARAKVDEIRRRIGARRRQASEGKHMCHWPTCDKVAPPKMWGCRDHWFRLPKILRDKIWAAYVPGQEVRKDPSPQYLAVMDEVEAFIRSEIDAGRPR